MSKGTMMTTNKISCTDQECVSLLMSFKHRTVTPPSVSSLSSLSPVSSVVVPTTPYSKSTTPLTENDTCNLVHSASTLSSTSILTSPRAMKMFIPLATDQDRYHLNELQCFIRSYCCEVFESDTHGVEHWRNEDCFSSSTTVSTNSGFGLNVGGGRGPIPSSNGRVGIRCSFCKNTSPHMRASQSMSFPSTLGGIYGSVALLQCQHVSQCSMMPIKLKNRLHHLLQRTGNMYNSNNNSNEMQHYWIDSARNLGIVETPHGLAFPTPMSPQHPHQQVQVQGRSHVLQVSPSPSLSRNDTNLDLVSNACVTLNTSDSKFKVPASDTLTSGGRNQRNSISCLGNNISSNISSNISNISSSSSSSSRKSSSNSNSNQDSSNNKNKINGKKKRKKRNSKVPLDCFGSLDEYKQYRESHTPRNEKEEVLPEVSSSSTFSSNPNEITDDKLVQLMGDTRLVELQDKDLVPDYLFLAMAQMTPCRLTDADRVGCYKEREAGFLGMCCKHCGGQPGFGKYFPATVRSLAQTTTSQTILKHIAVKCRNCPPEIRLAVVALQLQQAGKDKAVKEANGSVFESRPRYGSRKIFFQRLWSRLHGDNLHGDNLPASASASAPTSSTNLVPSRKRRRAVVSPTLTFNTKFSNGWPSNNNARPMITNDENNMNQSNMNHNHDNMNGNNHFQYVNENKKRSRSVSYVDGEHEDKHSPASRRNSRMGRMVRHS